MSLTTLGQDDPVSEHNSKLWKTGLEANQEIVRKFRKRRMHYVSNILVVKDAKHPENEGKVFLYKYGMKIFEKLRQKFAPTPEELQMAKDEGTELVVFNPFDLFEGANFTLRAKTVMKQRNYDDSTVATKQTPIADSGEEIERIWKSAHSLKDIIAPDKFKSYDELKKRFSKVIGEDGGDPLPQTTVESGLSRIEKALSAASKGGGGTDGVSGTETDPDVAMFQSLVAEDE